MDIAINCRSFLNKKYTGIGRYSYYLVKTLTEIDRENRYHLYARKGFFSLKKRLPRFYSPNVCMHVDRWKKGMNKTLGKVDIYHSPSLEDIHINNGARVVVTVHDLIFKTFPQGHTQKTIDDTEKQFEGIVKRACKIICCSQNTKKDLQQYFQVPDEKISQVYQGVDKNLFYIIGQEEELLAERVIRAHGVRDPFILCVGTIEPRKNIGNVLHAFDRLRTRKEFKGKLVVIGMQGWMSEGIESLIRKLELKDDVFFLGYMSDTELRYFYNKAEAFVFPSFYEGFGFPIVEAFCCGAPVITSNVSSCPEVAQDAAVIVDPYHPEEIAEGIARVVNDPQLRADLRDKGFRRAGDFTFRKTAERTLAVYQEAYRL